MAYQQGQSGNPHGTGYYRPFREALLRRIKSAGSDYRRLDKLAETLLRKAEKGEPWAMTLAIERIDGKAPQALEITQHSVTNNVVVSLSSAELAEILQLLNQGGVGVTGNKLLDVSPVLPDDKDENRISNDINELEDKSISHPNRGDRDEAGNGSDKDR